MSQLGEYTDLLIGFRAAMTVFDQQIARHEYCVGVSAALLAEELELSSDEVRLVSWVGLLHDHGKMARVRGSQGSLAEVIHDDTLRTHPQVGASVLRAYSPSLELVAQGVLAHHERWDGGGFPGSLRAEEIPLSARVVAVANTFNNLRRKTGDAPQKQSLSAALLQVEAAAGFQLDPGIVSIYLRRFLHDAGPPRISSGAFPLHSALSA